MLSIDLYWGSTVDAQVYVGNSLIREWAPYKQSVLIKENNGLIRFGDGSTVKNPKHNDKRVHKTLSRMYDHLFELTQKPLS
jgi:hypothetical protein